MEKRLFLTALLVFVTLLGARLRKYSNSLSVTDAKHIKSQRQPIRTNSDACVPNSMEQRS